MEISPQGEIGGPGQKGSKGDKGESVSMGIPVRSLIFITFTEHPVAALAHCSVKLPTH